MSSSVQPSSYQLNVSPVICAVQRVDRWCVKQDPAVICCVFGNKLSCGLQEWIKKAILGLNWTLSPDIVKSLEDTHNDVTKTEGKLKTKVFGGGGGVGREEAAWWRSVEFAGRLYLSCSVYQLLLFQLLMTWCQSLSLKALTKTKSCFFLLSWSFPLSPSPSRLLYFVSLFLGEGERASQNSAYSHATAASKIISLPLCVASISIHNADCS